MPDMSKPIIDKPVDYADWWDRPGPAYEGDADFIAAEPHQYDVVDGRVTLKDGYEIVDGRVVEKKADNG
jgi:hypothetical protein